MWCDQLNRWRYYVRGHYNNPFLNNHIFPSPPSCTSLPRCLDVMWSIEQVAVLCPGSLRFQSQRSVDSILDNPLINHTRVYKDGLFSQTSISTNHTYNYNNALLNNNTFPSPPSCTSLPSKMHELIFRLFDGPTTFLSEKHSGVLFAQKWNMRHL